MDSAQDIPGTPRARIILDISKITLADRPSLLEDHLRQTRGVLSVEINAFSWKIAIEFDPTLVSLDTIKRMIFSGVNPSTPANRSS